MYVYEGGGRVTAFDVVSGDVAWVHTRRGFEVCLFYVGTRNLYSPSYSPATGLYYVGINNSCMDVTFVSEEYRPGRLYSGIAARVKTVPEYDYVGVRPSLPPQAPVRRPTGRRANSSARSAR